MSSLDAQHGTDDPRTFCWFSQVNSTHTVETQSSLKCLTFCLFPEDVHVASSTTLSAQATASCCLWESQNLSKHVITCESNLPFCVDKEKENPAKPYRGLPQASHGIGAACERYFFNVEINNRSEGNKLRETRQWRNSMVVCCWKDLTRSTVLLKVVRLYFLAFYSQSYYVLHSGELWVTLVDFHK